MSRFKIEQPPDSPWTCILKDRPDIHIHLCAFCGVMKETKNDIAEYKCDKCNERE